MFHWIDAVNAPLLVVGRRPLDVYAANRGARELLEVRVTPSLPQALDQLASIADEEALERALIPDANGQYLQFSLNVAMLSGGVRRVACSVGHLGDEHLLLTLRDDSEPALKKDLIEILDRMPVAIEIYDRDLNAIFYNKMSDELFLYEQKAIVHHDEWWEFGFPNQVERAAAFAEWQEKMQIARSHPGHVQFSEWTVRCRDGSDRIVQFRYRWIGDNYVLALWDVTIQRETEQRLRHLAVSDPLTGLWNRRRLTEDAQAELRRATEGEAICSLLMIDIDHFKSINDRYGHGVGDDVLRSVAMRCLGHLRKSDVVARIGGEEFAALLPNTGPVEARIIAERLLEGISATVVTVGNNEIEVTASIGGVSSTDADGDVSQLMERGDRALYRAKETGRNRVVFDS